MIHRFLSTLALYGLCGCAAAADEGLPPGMSVERPGNDVRVTVDGQLAPTRDLPCLRLVDVRPIFTPPLDGPATWRRLRTTYLHCA